MNLSKTLNRGVRNNALIVRRIESLVEKYNKLAAERNMASMPYPSYGNIEVVSKSILFKDLATMKNAVEKIEEIDVDSEKVVRDVEFDNGEFINGMWKYALNNNEITVTYIDNGETQLDLTYDDMPFERIYTKDNPVSGYPVTSYTYMFNDASSTLTSIVITGWTNKNVKYMDHMFDDCSSLDTLNISEFNTSQVKNMENMFHNCSKISTLDLSNWDTSQVTIMSYMFYGCSSLETLNISGWDTSKVTDMQGMFMLCSSLASLDLSSFNTRQVTDMAGMFNECSNLTQLNLSNWDTSSVTTHEMFIDCPTLTVTAINAKIDAIIDDLPTGSTVQETQ